MAGAGGLAGLIVPLTLPPSTDQVTLPSAPVALAVKARLLPAATVMGGGGIGEMMISIDAVPLTASDTALLLMPYAVAVIEVGEPVPSTAVAWPVLLIVATAGMEEVHEIGGCVGSAMSELSLASAVNEYVEGLPQTTSVGGAAEVMVT